MGWRWGERIGRGWNGGEERLGREGGERSTSISTSVRRANTSAV